MGEVRTRKTYREADLAGEDLDEVAFEQCQFLGASLADVRVGAVAFEDSKLVGLDFRKCRMLPSAELRFMNCVLDACNFSDVALTRVAFVGCELRRCTFLRTDLTGADFSHSDLTETLIHDCDLSRADFSRTKNYAIDPNKNKLGKTKFSLPEAVSLLRGFDIELRNPTE